MSTPTNSQKPLTSPVPGRVVLTYPTPVLANGILIEYVSSEVGMYQPLEYSTPFDSVEHTAFSKAYPGYQLVDQRPADVNGWTWRRTWANPRSLEETYNYSITYQEQSPDHPIITRSTLVKRSEYSPESILSPDPVNPAALLVNEQVINQTDPPEVGSLYFTVVKIYQVLPGPLVLSYDFDENLNAQVQTSRQVVVSTDTFDPATIPLLLAEREDPQGQATKLRVISQLLDLPEAFTEEATGTYQFPTLVFDIPLDKYQLTTDPERSEVYWYFDKTDAPQVPALLKTTTSFTIGEPPGVALFVLPVQTLFYRGVSYQITISGVLNDEIGTSAVFTADARYGDLAESHTFSETAITATDYQDNYIGTWQVIGCDIKRFRGQIYTMRTTSVYLL